jgi:beta-glucosidase/6-phospho-beta-glucosidase/beta-galactosidase
MCSPPRTAAGPGIRFGVATSDHQCEAYDESFEDVNDRWERRDDLVARGRATDFWNRYPEDVELARGLGCSLFRLSISWARVEPHPGVFHEGNLRHYQAVVDEIRRAGMDPVVTLLHGTWPIHVEESGSLWSPGWPERFTAYASRVAEALGSRVDRWITINEPTMLPLGYLRPFWMRDYPRPPGLPAEANLSDQLGAVASLIGNLFRANAAAYDALKRANPRAMVTANAYLFGVPAWMQRLLDGRLSRTRDRSHWDRQLSSVVRPSPLVRLLGGVPSILSGNWWHIGMAGGLPADLCPTGCAGKQDAVALDYYWGAGSLDLPAWRGVLAAIDGRYTSAPTCPPLLGELLRSQARLFPGQPLWVVENGCVDRARGISRSDYLRQHVAQVRSAVAGGVPVDSYLCWSITTNREWGLPAGPGSDFGLYHVDLDGDPDLRRVPTESASVYRDLIAGA